MLIIHGDNQIASRDCLISSKTGKQVLEFFGNNLNQDQINQALNTQSLFGQVYTVVIEGIFRERQSSAKKDLLAYLAKNQSADIIIWESKDVTSQLKDFDSKLIRKFDLPKHIFKFLDDPTIENLQLALNATLPEIVFASLVTRAHKQAKINWLKQLLQIDYAQKTSISPYDLAAALEMFVIRLS